MKKTIILSITFSILFVLASILTVKTLKEDDSYVFYTPFQQEVLAEDEEPIITCRCAWFHSECAVGNWGGICAAGNPVHCDEYDGNC